MLNAIEFARLRCVTQAISRPVDLIDFKIADRTKIHDLQRFRAAQLVMRVGRPRLN